MGPERAGGVLPGILVTHGDLGRALLRVVESILGPQDGIHVLTNTEVSSDRLQERVEGLLEEMPPGPVFVFVDLLGGSCGHACLNIQRGRDDVRVISGVNLPMLVEFAHKRARLAPEDLLADVRRKGQEGIRCLPAKDSS